MKKNQTEITELKNAVIDLKNSQESQERERENQKGNSKK